MTAYQAMMFSAMELNKINQLKAAIASGAVKEKNLPADTLQHLTAENIANLQKANSKAAAVVVEELKEWYQ